MKTIVLITMASLLSIAVNSQIVQRFNYKLMPSGSTYTVTPVFDQFKIDGKKGLASFSNDCYVNNLLSIIIKEVLPKEKLSLLHFGNTYIITFNSNGEILYSWFLIKDEDKNVISENDLYNLYIKFKQIKIDMSKVKIIPGDPTEEKLSNYAEIFGPLIPKDCK